MSKPWTFEEHSPKAMNRNPIEAEFFTGEEDSEEVYGRTDALVRETIQNSLDARDDTHDGPVRVTFAISKNEEIVPSGDAEPYLRGLIEHLDSLGNTLVNKNAGVPNMPFLTIEDFGTRGLCGDYSFNGIDAPDDGEHHDFYWFWRNVGRSGKGGTDRGRWGLGKTVFPSTSRINTLFGLTQRSSDGKHALMGQAITRMHAIDGKTFVPEGFYCDPHRSDELQMPIEDTDIIASFSKVFRLDRGDESGLSIVVPYPFERIRSLEILRTVIVHFFYPIQRGDLVVAVSGPDIDSTEVTAETIRDVANKLEWSGSPKDKKHAPPPFSLADWAIERQSTNTMFRLNEPSGDKVPTWGEHQFDPSVLSDLQRIFDNGERIALRVPMTVLKKGKVVEETYFDVFIERDSDLTRSDDHFVREGMTISKISTLAGIRGIRGLLVVEDKTLSALLGDAEGPAHTEWGTGEARPDETYDKWKRRVTFVRNSIAKLLTILAPPPEGLDEDWLQDIFSIEDPKSKGAKKRKKKRRSVDPPPPPEPDPEPSPPMFTMPDCRDGFRIAGTGSDGRTPSRIVVRVAYDIPDGNPFGLWSPFDFKFDEGKTDPLKFSHRGLSFEKRSGNRLVILPQAPDFDLQVTGFDTNRDVIVKAVAEEASE